MTARHRLLSATLLAVAACRATSARVPEPAAVTSAPVASVAREVAPDTGLAYDVVIRGGRVLDGAGNPRALIRTTSVEIVPFGEVGGDFALAEGEGDTTGEEWREGHRGYFARVLDREIGDDMPVVCERFELRYPR